MERSEFKTWPGQCVVFLCKKLTLLLQNEILTNSNVRIMRLPVGRISDISISLLFLLKKNVLIIKRGN